MYSGNAFHSSPQADIPFSQLAIIASMINMPSTNDTKHIFLLLTQSFLRLKCKLCNEQIEMYLPDIFH